MVYQSNKCQKNVSLTKNEISEKNENGFFRDKKYSEQSLSITQELKNRVGSEYPPRKNSDYGLCPAFEWMQREQHETEIQKRLQLGLDHKKLFENSKLESRNP